VSVSPRHSHTMAREKKRATFTPESTDAQARCPRFLFHQETPPRRCVQAHGPKRFDTGRKARELGAKGMRTDAQVCAAERVNDAD